MSTLFDKFIVIVKVIVYTDYVFFQTRLQMHEDVIKTYLGKKPELQQQLELLKVVSYLTPFLMGMKKRMKIPDINRLLMPLTGEEDEDALHSLLAQNTESFTSIRSYKTCACAHPHATQIHITVMSVVDVNNSAIAYV